MSDTPPIQLHTPEAGNRGAGEMLRLAREAQGLSLEALAMILKVSSSKLLALEDGRLDQLPDPSYARALAQTVCRALKIDAAPVLAALPAARPSSLGGDKPPLNQPFKEARLAPHMFERHGGLDLTALLSLKWFAPLSLLMAATVVYLLPDSVAMPDWLARTVSTVATDAAPAASSGASGADAPEMAVGVALGEASLAQAASEPLFSASGASGASGALGVPDATVGAPSVPAVPLPNTASPVPASATPTASGPVMLPDDAPTGAFVLRANEDAWMEVVDGAGIKRLSRLVKSGEALSIGGVAPWRVRIGNATGVHVTLRGQPVDLSAYVRNNVARFELK
jgi:cytoskeleton protein RodZ